MNMGRQVERPSIAMISVSDLAAQAAKLKYKMALLRVVQFHRGRSLEPRVLDIISIGSCGSAKCSDRGYETLFGLENIGIRAWGTSDCAPIVRYSSFGREICRIRQRIVYEVLI